jgi:hypothetical protein
MEHTDRPKNTTITRSDRYRLKLLEPRADWVRVENGKTSYTLKFVDAEGRELRQYVSNNYGDWKRLAIIVGGMTGKYTEALNPGATPDEFVAYVKPACGHTVDVAVEVSDGKTNPKTGTPYINYKLTFPRGAKKPAAPAAEPGDDSVPF